MQLYPGRFMLELESWHTPASDYPRKKSGKVRIQNVHYSPGFYNFYGVRAADGERYQNYEAVRPLRVTSLSIDQKEWMVDDPPHWHSTLESAAGYKGHVLCAGLGLGLIVHALRQNPAVTRVTVVERCAELIDLVWPIVAPRGRVGGPDLTIYRGDWWEVRPDALAALVAPVDGVFFDLLVGPRGEGLFGEALHALKDARRRWPGVRHHVFGADTESLGDVLDSIDAASRLAEAEAACINGNRNAARKRPARKSAPTLTSAAGASE